MNLYLLSQSEKRGYDTYDSCVVAAKSEEEARKIHPSGDDEYFVRSARENCYGSWAAKPEGVTVELIGKAVKGTESGVICSSFNAG